MPVLKYKEILADYNELAQKNRFQSVPIAALCLYNIQRNSGRVDKVDRVNMVDRADRLIGLIELIWVDKWIE